MIFFSAPVPPPSPTNVQLRHRSARPSRMCWHTLERMDPAARTIQVGCGGGCGGGVGGRECTEGRGQGLTLL